MSVCLYLCVDVYRATDNICGQILMTCESLCRERWFSIKSCYIRHLKYSVLNSKRKAYYLADYLDFLLPYVVDRVRVFLQSKKCHPDHLPTYLKEVLPPKESYPDIFRTELCNVIKEEEEEEVDVEGVSDSEWMEITPEVIQEPTTSNHKSKRSPPKNVTKTANPSKKVKTEESKPRTYKDDDLKFFESILPDIARMSNHPKLKFKQEALSIIEDILYAGVVTEENS
ncbi:uncharacterized protein LOC128990444 isoform X2 [Macrosteles quadrilineatus]|uniref:uncharacterized protein LOC128990444 isoform X2 n=1 Tax=Macrosteles quadrilineatus TaxID=74068 RepID=UPI0023E173B8|nr:uncharacterized protein LOC128990444 isoform X2 [Macrosteles quadrilineatus]